MFSMSWRTRTAKMVRCSGARIKVQGPLSEEQIAKLQKYLSESGFDAADVARFCRTFRVERLDQLPAAKFEQAIKLIVSYRAHRAGGPSREEIVRAMEQDPVFRRWNQHRRAGMDSDEAYDLSLAEELAKRPLRPLWLLKRVAERFLAMHNPKLEAWHRKRVHEPALERGMIDALVLCVPLLRLASVGTDALRLRPQLCARAGAMPSADRSRD